MKFDAYAVLAKLRSEGVGRAIHANRANPQLPNRTNSTISTGQVIPWPWRGYHPEAICKGVAKAFADHEAQNDPFRPEAWS